MLDDLAIHGNNAIRNMPVRLPEIWLDYSILEEENEKLRKEIELFKKLNPKCKFEN